MGGIQTRVMGYELMPPIAVVDSLGLWLDNLGYADSDGWRVWVSSQQNDAGPGLATRQGSGAARTFGADVYAALAYPGGGG